MECMPLSGADPGFQVRGGAHLKKMRRAEGGANIFGVFRVKNQDFTPKNHNNRTPGRSIRPKSGSIRTDNYKYVGY